MTIKSVIFLFLFKRRCPGAACGIGISKVLSITSIDLFLFSGIAVSIVRLAFSDLAQMSLASELGTFNYVDHISISFLNCINFPERFIIRKKISFSVGSSFWAQYFFVQVLFIWEVACRTQTWFYVQTLPRLGVMMMVCCRWA